MVSDLLKKALTVGVGAAFLTEEALRNMLSELKLPKETLASVLQAAGQIKTEWFQKVTQEIVEKIQNQVDMPGLIQEILEKNEVQCELKIRFKPLSKD